MGRPVVRFALACLLFAGWMGYLIYLAVTTAKPDIVSRPQLLVADLIVAAQVDSLDGPVVIKEVLAVQSEITKPEVGDKIQVDNLKACKRLAFDSEKPEEVPLDWKGPGVYLLPLRMYDGKTYQVAVVPRSPGFPPRRDPPVTPTPRLYPFNDETRRQLRDMQVQ